MIPNPSHETRQSGRTAARHARNVVYHPQSWLRIAKKGRVKPKTVVRGVLSLSNRNIINHCNVMAPEIIEERPVVSETVKVHSDLPMDVSSRFIEPNAMAELKALIDHALSIERPTRRSLRTVIVDGMIKTVTEELPARKLETLTDFIEAFPSMREALIRLATLNQSAS